MKSKSTEWTKSELRIYILLLCANADSLETEEEINLIKSKTDHETFIKMYNEFSKDDEEESLDKIEDNINMHAYTDMELAEFRKEIYELFKSDNKIDRKERNIDRILDNILY